MSTTATSPVSASREFTSSHDLAKRPGDVAFDYLKATVILMVVAHHSCLAEIVQASLDRIATLAFE